MPDPTGAALGAGVAKREDRRASRTPQICGGGSAWEVGGYLSAGQHLRSVVDNCQVSQRTKDVVDVVRSKEVAFIVYD